MEIINLDMTPSTVTPNAHAGQYDASRIVRFMLKNGGVPFTLAGTETITAEITRSDNTEVTVNVANTSSNYVDVVFDDTVCTVKGLYACELRLKDSDGFDIGSKNFALLVQRDPYDGAGIHVETVGPADICTFETTLPEPLQSVIVDIEATGGNGTPDSPNPINGYIEANITRCGVNLWDEEWELGTIDSNGVNQPTTSAIRSKNYIPIKGNRNMYQGIGENNTYSSYIVTYFYDVNKTFIPYTGTGAYNNGANPSNGLFTSPENAVYMKMRMTSAYGTTYNNDIISCFSNVAVAYTAYNGQTYAIAFGQTVYGGVLDVTRGKLHVAWANLTFAELSTKGWNLSGSGIFYLYPIATAMPNILLPIVNNPLCSSFAYQPGGTMANNTFRISDALYIKTDEAATASDFKTWLANNTGSFAYELATPFDIDLTPEVISAVVGENNVFADCGQTTVKYLKAGE